MDRVNNSLNSAGPSTLGSGRSHGVFVIGAFSSGCGQLAELLGRLGFKRASGSDELVSGGLSERLASFNERLFGIAGGSWRNQPRFPPTELARVLSGRDGDIRSFFDELFGEARSAPWVLADPRFSFLAPLWSQALGYAPQALWVYRDPAKAIPAIEAECGIDRESAGLIWERYNRAALISSKHLNTAMVSYDQILEEPAAEVDRIREFLERSGFAIAKRIESPHDGFQQLFREDRRDLVEIDPRYRVLHRLLLHMSGSAASGVEEQESVSLLLGELYDEDYYSNHRCGRPYPRGHSHQERHLEELADRIVSALNPRSVLDAGCAVGSFVEALRKRGVDASGIDISPWAIKQVPDQLQKYCSVASVVEPLLGRYDLITCFEVLEHLPASLAPSGIANLCSSSDAILLSSSPDYLSDPTRINVEPVEYWAKLFAVEGFFRDFSYDADFLSPRAVLFRRQPAGCSIGDVIAGYERELSDLRLLGEEEGVPREELFETVAGITEELEQLTKASTAALAELATLRNTKLFRYSSWLRRAYGWAGAFRDRHNKGARPSIPASTLPVPAPALAIPGPVMAEQLSYEQWVSRYDTWSGERLVALGRRLGQLGEEPLISVLMATFNSDRAMLRRAIESVQRQVYENWELCIADDASSDPAVLEIVEEYAAADQRIKWVHRAENGHISAACNSAFAISSGSWVCTLDHDDELAEQALALCVLGISGNPDAAMVYTDEDKIDLGGARFAPFFKPDFDPVLLLGQNYPCHLTLFRRELMERAGGYREGLEGSQDWDLVIRVAESLSTDQIVHIPHVLYHWRSHEGSTSSAVSTKGYAVDAGHRAIADHLARKGLHGRVITNPITGMHRVKWALPEAPPKVSVVITTSDGRFLPGCVDSLMRLTTYPNFELIVADNASRSHATLDFLMSSESAIKVITQERALTYPELINRAVARCDGEVICLLSDDCDIISGDWLDELVSQLLQDGVGAVGAKLLYFDRKIEHAGIILGIGGVAGYVHRFSDRLEAGNRARLHLVQSVSAVSGVCMAIRRQAWEEVDGFDEKNLPNAFSDVDLCLRLGEAGWRIVWTPFAELVRHRSSVEVRLAGRLNKAELFVREADYMTQRWGSKLVSDPFYNPNLTLAGEDSTLAFPPRIST